jgi:DNA-binding winged helix-turn-helix (wHTH) protein/tetratricopeptide (TPR) repeat protein
MGDRHRTVPQQMSRGTVLGSSATICYFSLGLLQEMAEPRVTRMLATEHLTYCFGEFELEPHEHRLSRNGEAVALTPKVFDTLLFLVERAGHVVRKDELLTALWPRGFVDEATLSNHIWQIRRALGDTAKRTRFIETVPKVGYRFAAAVTNTAPPAMPPSLPAALPGAPAAHGRGGLRPWLLVGATLLIAVAIVAMVQRKPAAVRLAAPQSTAAAGLRLALVPFTSLSQVASDGWLAPTLAIMLGNELGASDALHVLPATTVQDAAQGLAAPGGGGYPRDGLETLRRRLDVDLVVSGAYLVGTAREDPTLRLDVVVQDARTGATIASLSRETNLSALNWVVGQTGASLRNTLGIPAPSAAALTAVSKTQPPTPEVARHVGTALDAMSAGDAARARDQLLEAIAQAPGYAPAYLYLAKAWMVLGSRQKAVAAAEQAAIRAASLTPDQRLQIDATLETARYDWKAAAASWQALVTLKPAALDYRIEWIDALLAAGEPEAARTAVAELRRSPQAADDPRATLAAARVADVGSDARASAALASEALAQAQARGMPVLVADAQVQLGTELMHLGDNEAARQELTAAVEGYDKAGNPHGEIEARSALAAALDNLQRGQEAADEYLRALALAQRMGDSGAVAAIYRSRTTTLWMAGDRDGAEVAARHALQISRDNGDLRLQAWTLRALATIASDDAASDEVLSQYREVTVLTERSHDAGGHVWSLATNADTLRLRGQLDEAHDECTRAQREAAALSDPQFMTYSAFICAQVAVERGENDTARALLEVSGRLSEQRDEGVYAGNTQLLLGQLDLDASKPLQARAHLDAASARFAGTNAETGEADAQALLALCAQALGDAAARDRAAARAATLRAAITARQEIYIVDIALAQLAEGPIHRGEAIARLAEIATDAERRHWLTWAMEAKLAQWRLLRLQGDAAGAAALTGELQATAREHGYRRILALMKVPQPG